MRTLRQFVKSAHARLRAAARGHSRSQPIAMMPIRAAAKNTSMDGQKGPTIVLRASSGECCEAQQSGHAAGNR